MGRRCRQQYFQQQPVIYYQPRRNRCQQPLQTNCQQAMQAPSCAAPRDTFSTANAASAAKVESKQAETVVLSEANLKEYGLDQTKYSVTNFYEASFNINGTQVPYLIVHDLRKDAKVPIYMMPKAEAQSKSGNLWNEAQGTSSKHWKLANEALQKLVIAKSNEKAVAKESEQALVEPPVIMPPVAETMERKVMPVKPKTEVVPTEDVKATTEPEFTDLTTSAPENFGLKPEELSATNSLYQVKINNDWHLINHYRGKDADEKDIEGFDYVPFEKATTWLENNKGKNLFSEDATVWFKLTDEKLQTKIKDLEMNSATKSKEAQPKSMPVTPEPVVDEKITGLRRSAQENFGFQDPKEIPEGNFLYDVEINGETNLIHLSSKGEVRVAPFDGQKVQDFKRLNPNREMLSNKDIWSPASDKLSKMVKEFRANQALDEGPRPPLEFAPEPEILQLPTSAMPDKESNTAPKDSPIEQPMPKPLVDEKCLVSDSWLDKKTAKVMPEKFPDLSVAELLNLAPKRKAHDITAEDIKEVKELRPPVTFAPEPEPLVIQLPSPESLVISGLTKAVKEIPNGFNVLTAMGTDISNQYNEFQAKAKSAQEEALRNKMQPPVTFAAEPERRIQGRPALFDNEPVERAKQDLPKVSFDISIKSISEQSPKINPKDIQKFQLSSGNDASRKALGQLKIESVKESFKNKSYKIAKPDRGLTRNIPVQVPEIKASKPVVSNPESKLTNPKPEAPMVKTPAKNSKEKVTGKLFTFDDTALKTLEKIGPTAQKSIFGSFDPKNSIVERIASDDNSINLVYSHPGKDAVAIKIYKEGKKVNLKATLPFANQNEAIEALKNTPTSRLFTRTKEGGIYPLDRFPYLMYLVNNGETENSSYHSISADLKNILEESGYKLVREREGQPYLGLKQR